MTASGSSPEIEVHTDLDALTRAAAERVRDLAREAIEREGRFSLALAGGGTPEPLYRRLASGEENGIPWPRIHLFWGDERCVPPDALESNYRMVRETLLVHVPIPEENIHRIPAEVGPTEEAARRYEELLRGVAGMAPPLFDLVLLGVGEDGHTASLFPGDPALEEEERWVVPVTAPPEVEPRERVTLTLPALSRGRHVLFLAAGRRKRRVVREILGMEEAGDVERYPAARIRARESVTWLIDEAIGDDT